jgi:hypothetical protein
MILSESESQRYLEDLFDLFVRHLVATVYKVSYPGTKQPAERIINPGFLLICRGRVFYLTAGHNLRRILTEGGQVDNSVFVDCFGPEAISEFPAPFPFADFPKFHVDIQSGIGLDLGLLEFVGPYKSLFQSLFRRNKVIPLEEQHWVGQDLSVLS